MRHQQKKIVLSITAMLLSVAVAEAGVPFATKGHNSNYIVQDTRVRDLDSFFYQSPFFPAFGDHTKLTTIVKRYPFDPRQLGMPRAKGSINVNYSCFPLNQTERGLGRGRAKFDAYGNAAAVRTVPADRDCTFYRAETTFKGNQRQVAGSSVSVLNSVQRLPTGAPDECFDRDVLCLLNARFKIEVDWTNGQTSGSAVPIATGYDQGLFYFFDPGASGLLVQVLDQCDRLNAFSFFAKGATSDLGWELTVTDTESGQVRSFEHPLGSSSPAITDPNAFNTCP